MWCVFQVPEEFTVTVDVRNPSTSSKESILAMLDEWSSRAGTGVTYKVLDPFCPPLPCTQIDPLNRDPSAAAPLAQRMWATLCNSLESGGYSFKPQVFPAATDGRHLREKGVPIVGISPLRNTPMLLHAHDEFLSVERFLEGLRVYELLIPSLANLPWSWSWSWLLLLHSLFYLFSPLITHPSPRFLRSVSSFIYSRISL